MNHELRAGITVRLSDDPLSRATDMHRITGAWLTFLEAIKELPVESSFNVDDAEPDHAPPGKATALAPRRRRGRPRLAVAEPPTAA